MSPANQKLNALLVGIDNYSPKSLENGVTKLKGCKNDVAAMANLLKNNFAHLNPAIETLTDAQATRKGIIDAFRAHLHQQADKHTSALFLL